MISSRSMLGICHTVPTPFTHRYGFSDRGAPSCASETLARLGAPGRSASCVGRCGRIYEQRATTSATLAITLKKNWAFAVKDRHNGFLDDGPHDVCGGSG